MSEKNENKELFENNQESNELDGVFQETDSELPAEEAIEEKVQSNDADINSHKKNGSVRMYNQNLLRRGSYTFIMIAIVLAVLVLVNVGATIIAQRMPTTIDVTTDRSNKLTKENIEYLKKIDQDVTITVCATKAGYTGGTMANIAQNYYYVQEIGTPYNYYNQTITIIEQYPKYNSRIKVTYVDPQKPDFASISSETDAEINYGDVVVQSTKKVDGKDVTLTEVLGFTTIYELNQDQQTGASNIVASNIESRLTGAIYKIAVNDPKKIGLLADISDYSSVVGLTPILDNYNYQVEDIKGAINYNTLKTYDMLVISKANNDLSANELSAIDAFLDNEGKKGKSLVFFASTSSPNLINTYQYLEEWGISVDEGLSYETESSYRDTQETTIRLFNKKSELTRSVNSSQKGYWADSNLPLSQTFETNGSKTSTVLMSTSQYAVIAPKGTVSGWKQPSDAKKGEIPAVIMTKDSIFDENNKETFSSVTVFSSSHFISDFWSPYPSVGNLEFAVTVLNAATGRDNTDMYFLPKITGVTSMSTSQNHKIIVALVVLVIIPVFIVIGGLLYWRRRVKR